MHFEKKKKKPFSNVEGPSSLGTPVHIVRALNSPLEFPKARTEKYGMGVLRPQTSRS